MVTVRQQLVSPALTKKMTWGEGSKAIGVAIHETGNRSLGADAAAHANLQSGGNVRSASWNWQVDDTEAVQSFPNGIRTWHAGPAGEHYVSIEICVNADGDYGRAVQNAIELVGILRSQGVGNKLVTHNELTGKDCPTRLLDGHAGGWSGFVAAANNVPRPPAPKPSGPVKLKEDGLNGPTSVGRYQQIAGTTADGKISAPSQFTVWLQRWLNARGFRDWEGKVLKVDGYGFRPNGWGGVTVRTRTDYALQQYLETTVEGRRIGYVGDGTWGFPSDGARIMQVEANAERLFK